MGLFPKLNVEIILIKKEEKIERNEREPEEVRKVIKVRNTKLTA